MLVFIFIILIAIAVLVWATNRIDKGIDDAFSPPGSITSVQGGTIHWVKQGEGPAIVLIHGLLGNGKNFSALADLLAKTNTVYIVDRPGSGFSSRFSSTPASFEQQSNMLVEWMEKIGIENTALVGHSMGGGIALRIALDAPSRVSSLTLLCPLTTPLTSGAGPLSALYIPNDFVRRSVSKTIASPLRVKLGKKQLAQVFHPEQVPTDFAVTGGGALALHSKSFYEGSRDTVSAQRSLRKQEKRYREIACPVGVLYGEMDAILESDTHMSAVTKSLPNTVSKTLEGAGHMIPVTQPKACAVFVRTFTRLA